MNFAPPIKVAKVAASGVKDVAASAAAEKGVTFKNKLEKRNK
ncbi:hypothetical protein ACFVHQ_01770 [Actinomycetes bacterium NPDC127524]